MSVRLFVCFCLDNFSISIFSFVLSSFSPCHYFFIYLFIFIVILIPTTRHLLTLVIASSNKTLQALTVLIRMLGIEEMWTNALKYYNYNYNYNYSTARLLWKTRKH